MASSIALAFFVTVAPYGWPRNSYYLTVPAKDRAVFFTTIVITYLYPSIVSVIMYSLLYHKIKLKITKVGAKPETVQSQSDFEFGNVYVKNSKSDLDLICGTSNRYVVFAFCPGVTIGLLNQYNKTINVTVYVQSKKFPLNVHTLIQK